LSKVFGTDLKARVISAVVLAVVAVALTLSGQVGFVLLVLIVAAIMAWEWGSVVRGDGSDWAFVVHAGLVALGTLIAALGYVAPATALVVIGALVVGFLAFTEAALMSGLGVLYTGLPSLSLVWLRSDPEWGLIAVLFILLVVAATDILAYFTGRAIGGPKLLPRISPNKTWSGFLGGTLGAAALVACASFFVSGLDWFHLFVAGLLLAIVSQVGDFAESAIKRAYGVKDASNLIPGHGGFMDRVDGLTAAAVAAVIVAFASGGDGLARALLGVS